MTRLPGPSDSALDAIFDKDVTLRHLWSEYEETLHKQKAFNPATGEEEVVAIRSTLPAEVFFNPVALVDSRLRSEFFKHLPGIFTGIGIIGTFSGLIQGLQAFQVSEDTNVVRNSLNQLLHGVGEAFLVSAGAIALAMIVTLMEKLLLASLYRKVEELAQRLDSLFEAGAGEEYLSRLVKASEESSSQTKILKDALVGELKIILTELTERQIAATSTHAESIGRQVAEGIETSLREPVQTIAAAVQQATGERSGEVSRLLTDTLAAFGERLQELFGNQITGINDAQQRTMQALQTAAGRLDQLVSNLEAAGRNSADAMASKLGDAITAMEVRQRTMNEQMGEFVQQIRTIVSDSQQKTGETLQTLLADLSDQVQGTVVALNELQHQAATQTRHTMDQVGGRIESLSSEIGKAMTDLRASVDAMQSSTSKVIADMNNGAETLLVAASDFAKAGQSVSGVLNQASEVSRQLAQSGASVAAASRPLEGLLADYRGARDSLLQAVATLEATVAGARKEASLTADVLQRIDASASRLTDVQHQADEYLKRIGEVLEEVHRQFSANITNTLSSANTEFFGHLAKATGLLRETIEELEVTLGNVFPPREPERR